VGSDLINSTRSAGLKSPCSLGGPLWHETKTKLATNHANNERVFMQGMSFSPRHNYANSRQQRIARFFLLASDTSTFPVFSFQRSIVLSSPPSRLAHGSAGVQQF